MGGRGRRWVPAGDGAPGTPQDHSWLRPDMTSPGLKHSGANPTFLTVCWVLQVWGPVFFKSFFTRVAPPPCALSLPKLASGLCRAGWGQDGPCVVAMGWGCCFSQSYLLCLSSSFVPLHASHPAALRPPLLPNLPPLNFWKAHLQYLCSLWDGSSVSSHALFVRVVCGVFSCVFFFSSFLSLSEKIVAAFLFLGFKKGFREVV